MNSLKEEANEYEEEEDRIRVYLNVKPSKASDKLFYNISLDNQKNGRKLKLTKFSHIKMKMLIYMKK